MITIFGLGNPGDKYIRTRHNAGFIILDYIASEFKINFKYESKFLSEIAEFELDNKKILLIKPQTYMNLSGDAVLKVLKYYNINSKNIRVIYDDKDIKLGSIRIRLSGSAAGHNGIKSIIKSISNDNFIRIRIGIGSDNIKDTVKYVLSNFTNDEIKIIKKVFDLCWNDILKENIIESTYSIKNL